MNVPHADLPYANDLESLQVATSTLMTRFYSRGCPGVAAAVIQHLETLLQHPQIQAWPGTCEGYRSLLAEWHRVMNHAVETRAKQRKRQEMASVQTAGRIH